jgi:hypothetical protein
MAGWDDGVFGNLPPPRRPGQGRPLTAQDIAAMGGIGTLAPANQSWGEQLGGAAANAAEAVRGAPSREGSQNASDITQKLAGLLPGLGQALSGNDAYRAAQQGNYGQATLAALGAVPVPGARAAKVAEGAAEEAVTGAASRAAKGLPQVAWDPGQQRWLTDKGKPITSSPLDLPEGAPSYPPMFDPNDPALAKRPEGVAQFDFPRAVPAKGPAVSSRVADLIANPDVRKQVMDYVQQGSEIGDSWYNTTPIRDSAIRALGPDAGPAAYEKYMGLVGATSPQQKVPSNLRTASMYYWRDANGMPPMEQGDPIPPLYGHYVQKQHQQNVKDYLESGGDALADYDPAHPKPPSFNQGLLGNYSPVAVDMHAFKLPAMLSRDPRFLATGVPKGAPGYPDLNPREAVTSGQISMDEAVKNPTWWEDQPNVKSEYPAMEQWWKGIGADLNKDPAQAQAGGWIGGGGVTGLGSPPETAAQSFEKRVQNTAYRTGATTSEAENNFWRGVHPLLSVAGGSALALPPMLQQYLNGQQQPAASGPGGAPAPPQFW